MQAPFRLPEKLDRFQIVKLLSVSDAIVFEAFDPEHNRPVVLKEVFLPPAAPQEERERFKRRFDLEVRMLKIAKHPRIIELYDVHEHHGHHFYSMEFLDGESVQEDLAQNGAFSEEESIAVATEALKALGHLHGLGIVHCDVKPGNIHLCEDGRVKLMDLGIARIIGEPYTTELYGGVTGTPAYLSPELVDKRNPDTRSDIFAMGSVLYEMVTGKEAFGGATPEITMQQVARRPLMRPESISDEMWRVISQATQKEPIARYQLVDDFIEALDDVPVLDEDEES